MSLKRSLAALLATFALLVTGLGFATTATASPVPYSPTASLAAFPVARASHNLRVLGSKFKKSETIKFQLDSLNALPFATTTANKIGAFNKAITLPNTTGHFTLYAIGATSGKYGTTSLTIRAGYFVPLNQPSGSTSKPSLSGTDIGVIIAGVAMVILVSSGTVLVRGGKRTRTTD